MRMHGMNQCVSSASVLLLRYMTCNHMIFMISVKNQIQGEKSVVRNVSKLCYYVVLCLMFRAVTTSNAAARV